ncbi:translation initiation factor IF-2 [Desulfuribacillus stibiiarsenatis]|uniref:Translation initiation factor IF-2 n=1 Tax=Desulfuribacillus stibiiarsenatis TaxID=1390249 RepID=A0A1E5L793_9FIRM|nr:translation initiation factor IF-2 [Desulfuribacillus stibiiarsenatis]OEH85859.1 translation initiation factor IF-2 [Desulfuribacillus stibiiarsenatis]
MSKIRIYEYAKNVNMSSKEILEILKRLNKDVGNHMSLISDSEVESIENYIKGLKNKSTTQTNNQKQAKPEGQNQQTSSQASTRSQETQTNRPDNRTDNRHQQNRPQNQQNLSGNRPEGNVNRTDTRYNKPENRFNKPDNKVNNTPRPDNKFNNNTKPENKFSNNTRPDNKYNKPENRPATSGYKSSGPDSRPPYNKPENKGFNKPASSVYKSQQPTKPNFNDREKEKEKENMIDTTVDAKGQSKVVKKEKTVNKFDKFSDTRDINGIKKNKSKKYDHRSRSSQPSKPNTEPPKMPSKIVYKGEMTVGDLAKALKKETSEIIKKLMFLGCMATINQEIDFDTITLICEEYGVAIEEKIELPLEDFESIVEIDDEKDLKHRPPVVTIMGHVDHGKTTLLDTIRETKVTEGEAGGITQHIGAYQVKVNDKKITFLDTPGHAAFTSMRARGAKITDITILVVAADDGVMPQTIEAINHAKAANVPIIVAVNKMDKPSANPDRVKQELTEYALVPEEWGGSTIFVPISALKNEGIEELLEMVLLVAEVEELKANPNKRARGTVIESQLDKGRGSLATVLVQSGTLKIGDAIIVGNAYGRIRAMINDQGKRVRTAEPSMPVEITGLSEVPNAGDQFMVLEDDKTARVIAEKRQMKDKQLFFKASTKITLDDLYKQIAEGTIKDLNLILKADVHGSVEALKGALEKIDIQGVQVRIVHTGVGAITESDVILASASNAIIIGFNVRPQPNAKKTAEHENVDIRSHSIIYKVIEEIESALKGLLDPEYKEVILGHAEVRQVIKLSKVGAIAGCYVLDGKIVRDRKARVIRDGIVIFEGDLGTLKRFKDDVKEVATNYECGITLEKYNDYQEGDIIEVFEMQKIERT